MNSDAATSPAAEGDFGGDDLDVKGVYAMGRILGAVNPGAVPGGFTGADELELDAGEVEDLLHDSPIDFAGDVVGVLDKEGCIEDYIDGASVAYIDFGKFFGDEGDLDFEVLGGPAEAADHLAFDLDHFEG
jgi:hypothetical protein